MINKHLDHYELYIRIIRFINKQVWIPDQPEKCQSIKFDGFSTFLLYLGYLFALATCAFLIEIIYNYLLINPKA